MFFDLFKVFSKFSLFHWRRVMGIGNSVVMNNGGHPAGFPVRMAAAIILPVIPESYLIF